MSALDVNEATRRARIAETIAAQSPPPRRPGSGRVTDDELLVVHNLLRDRVDKLEKSHTELVASHNDLVRAVREMLEARR